MSRSEERNDPQEVLLGEQNPEEENFHSGDSEKTSVRRRAPWSELTLERLGTVCDLTNHTSGGST